MAKKQKPDEKRVYFMAGVIWLWFLVIPVLAIVEVVKFIRGWSELLALGGLVIWIIAYGSSVRTQKFSLWFVRIIAEKGVRDA